MGLTAARINLYSLRAFRLACVLFSAMSVAAQQRLPEGNNSPQIEYISPDGQFTSLRPARSGLHQSATFVDNDTVSCVLKEGETTFIIELPKNTLADRFVFLNENAAACGELRIAVSDSPLPANSPKWTEVDGIVPFAHKRLFKLSMLGVDTKFVRLSFKVDNRRQASELISNPFRNSLLVADINSAVPMIGHNVPDFRMAAVSVAPLPVRRNR
jgi:hypothetical protein